ncbi:hypothetical protein FSARC_9754 [Fusarium sarcochroum]|uniref:Uncharacterized protein n=1 Tax=Fusarium sarcochroum TaxID=1208366 RepID=A0A8H4X5I3_9HYPO|nr:hypothetical protein FSARC_9754 [Fusarium sarcochroum]
MRWISLCTVLGAALLPAASARPLCRPDRSTSSGLAETTVTSTAASTYATTSVIESTVTETATTTDTYSQSTETEAVTSSGFTTLISSTITESETLTTAETTTITEEASTTTTEAASEPTPENLIRNGDFEDEVNVDWGLRTAAIINDAEKAQSPNKYAQFSVENAYAVGGNQLNQTINGLNTLNLFRLSFSAAVFDEPTPEVNDDTICRLEALQQDQVFGTWSLDVDHSLNEYTSYETNFVPDDEDITLTLRLRCDGGVQNQVTLSVGIDDVVLNELGPAPI